MDIRGGGGEKGCGGHNLPTIGIGLTDLGLSAPLPFLVPTALARTRKGKKSGHTTEGAISDWQLLKQVRGNFVTFEERLFSKRLDTPYESQNLE